MSEYRNLSVGEKKPKVYEYCSFDGEWKLGTMIGHAKAKAAEHMHRIRIENETKQQYRYLKVGDVRPEGYEFRHRNESEWHKLPHGAGVIITAETFKDKEYRIAITQGPILGTQVGTPTQGPILGTHPDKDTPIGTMVNVLDTFTTINGNNLKEVPMTKPETELEKTACEAAKQDAISLAIAQKKGVYQQTMTAYINQVNNTKILQKQVDELNKQIAETELTLGITEEQKKQLF